MGGTIAWENLAYMNSANVVESQCLCFYFCLRPGALTLLDVLQLLELVYRGTLLRHFCRLTYVLGPYWPYCYFAYMGHSNCINKATVGQLFELWNDSYLPDSLSLFTISCNNDARVAAVQDFYLFCSFDTFELFVTSSSLKYQLLLRGPTNSFCSPRKSAIHESLALWQVHLLPDNFTISYEAIANNCPANWLCGVVQKCSSLHSAFGYCSWGQLIDTRLVDTNLCFFGGSITWITVCKLGWCACFHEDLSLFRFVSVWFWFGPGCMGHPPLQ